MSHSVGFFVRPACQRSQAAQLSASSSTLVAGNASKMVSSSASNQACKTTFGQLVTPLTRTCPDAGWNNVSIFAVPCRMCSCG